MHDVELSRIIVFTNFSSFYFHIQKSKHFLFEKKKWIISLDIGNSIWKHERLQITAAAIVRTVFMFSHVQKVIKKKIDQQFLIISVKLFYLLSVCTAWTTTSTGKKLVEKKQIRNLCILSDQNVIYIIFMRWNEGFMFFIVERKKRFHCHTTCAISPRYRSTVVGTFLRCLYLFLFLLLFRSHACVTTIGHFLVSLAQ